MRFEIGGLLSQTSDFGLDVYLSARFLETSDPRSDVSQQERAGTRRIGRLLESLKSDFGRRRRPI